MKRRKQVCEKHDGSTVVHLSGQSCPCCRLLAEKSFLLGLMVQKGLLPPAPEDHTYYVHQELLTEEPGVVLSVQLLGPDWGHCDDKCTSAPTNPSNDG